MTRDHVDEEHLTITGAHRRQDDSHVRVFDDVEIVVTQAFGPRGDNLVGLSDVKFDGYPAVTVWVKAGGREGAVHLSPIHGDRRKAGFIDIEPGTKCELLCPVSRLPLPRLGEVGDGSGAEYRALYLTPKLEEGAMVSLTDVWDHYHSRIVDNLELISTWATDEPA